MSVSGLGKLPPRVIAEVLADLASPQVIEALEHLEAWEALTRAGVEVHDLRHALEAERVSTEAGQAVTKWRDDGERGVLVLRGPVDCGKTFAAVRWALDRHRRGLTTRWYVASTWPNSFEAMDQLSRQLERVAGLVIDDLGDGAASPEMRKRLQGLLGVRVAADLPTVIVSNATADELREWLGVRAVSRLKLGGGLIDIEATLDMRKREATPYDSAGRSPRWYMAKRTVDIFGAERRDVYTETGDLLERRVEVGHTLMVAARDPRRALDALDQVSRQWWISIKGVRIDMPPLFEVGADVIARHVATMRDRDRKAIAAAGRAAGVELDAQLLTWEAALADAHRIMRAKLGDADAERQAEAEKASRPRVRRPDPARAITLPSGRAPAKETCIREAYARGLRVREVGASTIEHVDGMPTVTRASTWAVYNGEHRMAEGFGSDSEAWHWAWLQVSPKTAREFGEAVPA
jgi:hypothetical protein